MKKLHKLIIKSYLGPFAATFFIAIFVLLLQFVWKYVDDLIGKGLETKVILELLVYTTATLVPMALPISVLVSSIMTFGGLGENFELVGFKSTGVSLLRIMKPLIVVSFLISFTAFYFSNNLLPVANLKSKSLLWDVRQQKLSLNIKEGFFYDGIPGYSIRVGKKETETDMLYDILIYDHTEGTQNNRVISAKKGKMFLSANEEYLILDLENGNLYEEIYKLTNEGKEISHQKTNFSRFKKALDMSSFKFEETKEELFKENAEMWSIAQLNVEIDSIENELKNYPNDIKKIVLNDYLWGKGIVNNTYIPIEFYKNKIKKDSVSNKAKHLSQQLEMKTKVDSLTTEQIDSKLETLKTQQNTSMAINQVENLKRQLESEIESNYSKERTREKYKVQWHKKFTLSIACLILFFIGAPLGAIIKKGGLGLPMVISIFFFIIFHILNIMGEKAVREMTMSAFMGMWMPSFFLFPIGVFLTYKASHDSTLMDIGSYTRFFKSIVRKNKLD